jgi:hypothetical protein
MRVGGASTSTGGSADVPAALLRGAVHYPARDKFNADYLFQKFVVKITSESGDFCTGTRLLDDIVLTAG